MKKVRERRRNTVGNEDKLTQCQRRRQEDNHKNNKTLWGDNDDKILMLLRDFRGRKRKMEDR